MPKEFKFNKLIQLPDFQWTLKSITDIGDKNSEWKADLIEFINSDSSDNSSAFFYDMLPFVRFVDEPVNQSAAYTTPDHRIWMNAPKGFGIGEKDYKWEFIYYHECMHQLWDTFDVQKNIEKRFGSCDMTILNIASDCVINDWLHVNKKMPYPTDGLITPELLEKEYGVKYDRSKDTQFGLYEKLLKVAEEIRKKQPPQQPSGDAQSGQGQSGQGQSGQGQSGQGQSGQGQSGQGQSGQGQSGQGQSGQGGQPSDQDIDKMTADEAAASAQKSADDDKAAAGNATGDNAAKAKDAAKRAQKAANEAKDAAKRGDAKTARDKAKEAAKAAAEAQAATNGGKGQGQGEGGNTDANDGYGDQEPTSDYFKKLGDKTIREYSGKITGSFGDFVRKCKVSQTEEKHEGVVVKQRRGLSWNKALDKQMNAFIQQKILSKKREMEPTYHRLRRGTRPVKLGDVIQPGLKVKDDKLNITIAFYIDRSGSMGGKTDKVFSLAYQLSDNIRKDYSSDKVVGEVGFRYFAFDNQMSEIKKGQTVSARGGTMSLHELLEYVEKQSKDDLVNIILTDAEFNIEKTAVVNLVRTMPGMFFLIANQPKPECDDIAKQLKGQFVFLEADPDFTLKK